MSLARKWKDGFLDAVQQGDIAPMLKHASLVADLTKWTEFLTHGVVRTCEGMGWVAAAKGHKLDVMPEEKHEFLGIDVMGFEPRDPKWLFPAAAIELENNQKDDRIAYSLWKVLNVRTPFRVVYCYRPDAEAGPALVKQLGKDVIGSMDVDDRLKLSGEIVVVVGYRDQAGTFPYQFFRWWRLDKGTGTFDLL